MEEKIHIFEKQIREKATLLLFIPIIIFAVLITILYSKYEKAQKLSQINETQTAILGDSDKNP